MKETNPYSMFISWLSNTTTPSITAEINRAFNLLQQHDTGGTYDLLIMKCTSDLEEKDATFVSEVIDILALAYQDTLPVYGIELESSIPLTHLRHLNDILEGILLIPDYEDVLALWDKRDLANSNRELFLNIIEVVVPEINLAEAANLIARVNDIFFERFDAVIKPKADLLAAELKMEENQREREIETLFRAGFKELHTGSSLLRQDPDFLHELRRWIVYYTDHEDIPFKDALIGTSEKLEEHFDNIPIRAMWSTKDIALYHASFLFLYYRILGKPVDVEVLRLVFDSTLEYSEVQGNPNLLNSYWATVDDYLSTVED